MELGNILFGHSRGDYEVDRDWQDNFIDSLIEMGFDSYGVVDNENLNQFVKTVEGDSETVERFENDTFILMPYYWGEDDKLCELPNFVYKKTGFALNWYKYPFRDSYMNQDIREEDLILIMLGCYKSVEKYLVGV